MERLLHYVWKYKLYASTPLTTTEGLPITVIDPGIQNTDAGPDFFNAKIKIDGTVWAGSVEIHEKASDWLLHHHDSDKAYDSVILHVTGVNDASICRMNGEPIPQLILPGSGTCPEKYRLVIGKRGARSPVLSGFKMWTPCIWPHGWIPCSVSGWNERQRIYTACWISTKRIGTRYSISY